MAKIPFGILGPFIGKVGPVIGYMRGDTWCVRSMPMHYRDARTEAQLRNRSKMTRLMGFLCSMKPVIRGSFDVWNSDNPCRTEFNMAFAENFHTALRTTAQGTEILYHKVRVADGLLTGLFGVDAYQLGDDIHISWSTISNPIAMASAKATPYPTDRLCICAHNADTGESAWDLCAGLRQDGRAVFAIPEGWRDGCVHLWAWFSNCFTSSSSVYLGEYGVTDSKQGLFELFDTYPGTSCHPSQEGMREAGLLSYMGGFDTEMGRVWYGVGSTLMRGRAVFGLGKGVFGLERGVFGGEVIRGDDFGGRNGPRAQRRRWFLPLRDII